MHRQPPPTRGSRVIDPLTGRVGTAPDEWSETQRHSVFTGALQHTRDAVDASGHRFPVSVLRLTIGLPSEAAMYRGGRGTARLRHPDFLRLCLKDNSVGPSSPRRRPTCRAALWLARGLLRRLGRFDAARLGYAITRVIEAFLRSGELAL